MAYEIEGTLKVIMDLHTSPSGFTKREFVITVGADRYPQDIKLEFVKDKVALLERYQVGQRVKVEFDIRGNEYNGRYYVSLSAWRIHPSEGGGEGAPPSGGGGERPAEPRFERPAFREGGGGPPRGGGGGPDRRGGGGPKDGGDRRGGGGFDRKGGGGGGGGRGGYEEYGGGGGGRRNRGGGDDDDIDF